MTTIIKGDGTKEEFQIEKLIASLVHSGADQAVAENVADTIVSALRDGMTTTEIYKQAFRELKKIEKTSAAKYSMRRAILELGPTGFPFEDFISEVMRSRGYTTKTRVMVKGRCVSHELDVVMEKEGVVCGAELKFHNVPGFKVDLKTALYVSARFQDIFEGAKNRGDENSMTEGWLITNTKFTSSTIDYAKCAGLNLLGWSYPHGESLSTLVNTNNLYPVTVLTSLSKAEKKRLLETGVTMCNMIAQNPETLSQAGVVPRKHKEVIHESAQLCRLG
ncbi:ATPase [Candidatus Kaiserbacteria bacterium CG10_big_fil_rev_8_21_14_0_10_45_20]|uniref:ATPase n=1 Tax=Candidatus Kaiserbacteria bacterium CG10_big_fil_rev_8_21_14_0_10_45_20 TaxID=1974607 RepID=A0A2H0UGL0_9BACT|nr:MAG: ATPase [Candidatus Kaiserbacteria bacterium CG10_big_fil_rev_8_21_14_0_10_45_20]